MKTRLLILCCYLLLVGGCSSTVDDEPTSDDRTTELQAATAAPLTDVTSTNDDDGLLNSDTMDEPEEDASSFVLPDDPCSLIQPELLNEVLGFETASSIESEPITNNGLYGCFYQVGGSADPESETRPTMFTMLATKGIEAKRQALAGMVAQDGGEGCIFSFGGSSSQNPPTATPLPPEYAALESLPLLEIAEMEREQLIEKCGGGSGLFRSIAEINGIGDFATYFIVSLGPYSPNLAIVKGDTRFTLQIVSQDIESFDHEERFGQLVTIGQSMLGEPIGRLPVSLPTPHPIPTVEACHDPDAPIDMVPENFSDPLDLDMTYEEAAAALGHPGEVDPGFEDLEWVVGDTTFEMAFQDGRLFSGSKYNVNFGGGVMNFDTDERFDRGMELAEIRAALGPETRSPPVEHRTWRYQSCYAIDIVFRDGEATVISAGPYTLDDR